MGDSMSSVVISGDTSGAITLSAPAVSGTNTATLPAATGTVMVSGNMPAFSVYQTSSQSLSAGTWTKITFDVEEFDTNSNFASSRFTPTIAGYYQINGGVVFGSASATIMISIYKNGSIYKRGSQSGSASASGQSSIITSVVYFNGSSDYVEIYGHSGVSNNTSNTIDQTWFNGTLVRSA
jgi:hypothetical protein